MKLFWNSLDALGKGSVIALIFLFFGYLLIFYVDVIR